jgi:hypothetical protein
MSHGKFSQLRLTTMQDSINISAAILDYDCRPLDIMEDPEHQGRPFLGMANATCNHRWVCAFVRLYKHPLTLHLAYQEHRCGSPSPTRT